MAWLTTGGPATKSWEISRTITEKWPSTAFAAPMPTTLPRSMFTTGTVESCSVNMELPRWPGRYDPPPVVTRGRPALMAPWLSWALLSPSLRCAGTIAATLPPPEEPSRRRIEGTCISMDRRSRCPLLALMAPSAWPPREVKSSAQTTTERVSILPQPPTWFAGVNSSRPPSSS